MKPSVWDFHCDKHADHQPGCMDCIQKYCDTPTSEEEKAEALKKAQAKTQAYTQKQFERIKAYNERKEKARAEYKAAHKGEGWNIVVSIFAFFLWCALLSNPVGWVILGVWALCNYSNHRDKQHAEIIECLKRSSSPQQ